MLLRRRLFLAILFQYCLFSLTQWAMAEKQTKYPLEIPGTKKVSAEEILQLIDEVPDLIIIDSRIKMDRRHGYIEGSVSLPDIDTTCTTLGNIIPDQTSPVLFYCNGIKCGRSIKSIKKSLKCGYKNIYWFRGGFEEWKKKNFPTIKQ